MKQQQPATKIENCGSCPAFMADKGSAVGASNFSFIPSRLASQMTEGVWNAVVTTLGKGTFLIRRRKMPTAACPLRDYEIRYIAADSPPDRNRREDSADHLERKAVCEDLTVRVCTGRMDSETRDA